jgi:hypothetical protein
MLKPLLKLSYFVTLLVLKSMLGMQLIPTIILMTVLLSNKLKILNQRMSNVSKPQPFYKLTLLTQHHNLVLQMSLSVFKERKNLIALNTLLMHGTIKVNLDQIILSNIIEKLKNAGVKPAFLFTSSTKLLKYCKQKCRD